MDIINRDDVTQAMQKAGATPQPAANTLTTDMSLLSEILGVMIAEKTTAVPASRFSHAQLEAFAKWRS